MSLGDILKTLQSLGLSPLEIVTVVALVAVYRKNEQLWTNVQTLQKSLDACIGKLRPIDQAKRRALRRQRKA